MLKKTMLAAALLASSLMTVAPASANDYEQCMLHAGCFFASGDGTSPGYWVCPEPPTYMECVE